MELEEEPEKKSKLESIVEGVEYGWDYISFRFAVALTGLVKNRVLFEALKEGKRRDISIRIVDRDYYQTIMNFYSGNPENEVVTYFEPNGDIYVPPILELAKDSQVYRIYKRLERFLTTKLKKLKGDF